MGLRGVNHSVRGKRDTEGVNEVEGKGRKPTARAKSDDVRRLKAAGRTGDQIAAELGIGRASVFGILQAHRANH